MVTDFSPVQLELNRSRTLGTAAEQAVETRELLDVCDTSRYRDGEFDAFWRSAAHCPKPSNMRKPLWVACFASPGLAGRYLPP